MRLSRNRRLGFVGAVSIAAVVLAACGGGSASSSKSSGATASGSSDANNPYSVANLIKSCSNYQATEGITDDSIKVGYSGALGGPYATVGVGLYGMLGYFDYVNSQGGVKGPDGKMRKIEVDYKDDQYTPTISKTNVTQMIDSDKVFAVLGVVGTSANMAIRPLIAQDCVPDLFATAGAPELGNPAYPWAINGVATAYYAEAENYITYLKSAYPNGVTVAMLYQHDDYGGAWYQEFAKGIQGTNIKLVKTTTYELSDVDVSSQITTLAATKADVFISVSLGANQLQSINLASATPTWHPQIIVSGGVQKGQALTLKTGAGDGMITAKSVDLTDPTVAATPVAQLYTQWATPEFTKNGVKLPVASGYGGWNNGVLFVQALEGVKTLDRANVMSYVHNFTPDPTNLILPAGVVLQTTTADPYLEESEELVKWNATTKTYTDLTLETGQVGKTRYSPVNS